VWCIHFKAVTGQGQETETVYKSSWEITQYDLQALEQAVLSSLWHQKALESLAVGPKFKGMSDPLPVPLSTLRRITAGAWLLDIVQTPDTGRADREKTGLRGSPLVPPTPQTPIVTQDSASTTRILGGLSTSEKAFLDESRGKAPRSRCHGTDGPTLFT